MRQRRTRRSESATALPAAQQQAAERGIRCEAERFQGQRSVAEARKRPALTAVPPRALERIATRPPRISATAYARVEGSQRQ